MQPELRTMTFLQRDSVSVNLGQGPGILILNQHHGVGTPSSYFRNTAMALGFWMRPDNRLIWLYRSAHPRNWGPFVMFCYDAMYMEKIRGKTEAEVNCSTSQKRKGWTCERGREEWVLRWRKLGPKRLRTRWEKTHGPRVRPHSRTNLEEWKYFRRML